MENQITVSIATVISFVVSIVIGVFGFFVVRMVKGYDGQIKELFDRTKDLPGIRTDIDWLKEELKDK